VKVVRGKVLVLEGHLGGFVANKVLDSLISLVVVLDKVSLTLGVDPLESVTRVSVHVAVAVGCAALRHKDSDLMECLGCVTPVVPLHVRVVSAGLRMSLLTVKEIGEFHRVLDEKDGRIVSNHVIVALLSVMLESETTRVTIAVTSTSLASYCGEAEEHWSALSNLVHEFCLGVLCDIVCHFNITVGS